MRIGWTITAMLALVGVARAGGDTALAPGRRSLNPDPQSRKVQLGLRVPAGFEVTEFAGSELANDIYCMTLDPKGRVVVSGRGYIRILVDEDGDGQADRAEQFAGGPADGAMGMLWEGPVLYFTGDGGLRRYRDENRDGRADGPSELIRKMGTGGEHSAHAIRRGPDGWLYVIGGNFTGFDASFAQLATSPITEPIAGCVLRFTPDLEHSEIVADGFRNAYDMDFNVDGDLFTYDSDNERCVSLPWYEPTRFYHVIPGGHYGWRAPQRGEFWRRPPYYADVVAPAAPLERGSPTGVTCYRQVQFPVKYRGGFFILDWTFGRVYFCPLEHKGSNYTSRPEVFLQSVGDNGFAPTDVVVHPETGDLYISIGGRGTRGAVYRVRYTGGGQGGAKELAELRVRRRSLGWEESKKGELLRRAGGDDRGERLRALTQIYRHRRNIPVPELVEVIRENWNEADRYIQQVTARLIRDLPDHERTALRAEARRPWEQLTYAWAVYENEPATAARLALPLRESRDDAVALGAVRVVQKTLDGLRWELQPGTVWETFALGDGALEDTRQGLFAFPAYYHTTVDALLASFPTGRFDLDREMARTLGALQVNDPRLLASVAGKLTGQSDPVEDIHYLSVLARLPGERSEAVTRKTAAALLGLDAKTVARGLNRDRNWPLRVAEIHEALARRDPKLNAVMLADASFGRADHVLFARAGGFDQAAAARVFLRRAAGDADFGWNADLVELVGELPAEESFPAVRGLWERVALHDAIVHVLARQPEAEDRQKFVEGLASPQLETISQCVAALERLPTSRDGMEELALVRALRNLPQERQTKSLRERIARLLGKRSGHSIAADDAKAWADWFESAYPELAARLRGADGVDVEKWRARLAGVDWQGGDAERGGRVFVKASCAACHSGARALGPDLRGVTARFSREDLFTAILQPSRDVPPRYQSVIIETDAGRVYQGAIIYEAVDGVILQTGPETTVRIPGASIVAQSSSPVSLMPSGLLEPLSDGEIADLYAYLRGLGK